MIGEEKFFLKGKKFFFQIRYLNDAPSGAGGGFFLEAIKFLFSKLLRVEAGKCDRGANVIFLVFALVGHTFGTLP